MDSNSSPKITS